MIPRNDQETLATSAYIVLAVSLKCLCMGVITINLPCLQIGLSERKVTPFCAIMYNGNI